MSDEERKKREELYAETRKDVLTRQLSNSERFDHWSRKRGRTYFSRNVGAEESINPAPFAPLTDLPMPLKQIA